MWDIDRYARVPIYEQVVRLVERYVLQGVLKPGDKLPSVRALSQEMNVNPNTLQKAYAELERRNICAAVPGSGRFVRADARETLKERAKERLEDLRRLAAELLQAGVGADAMVDCIQSTIEAANRYKTNAREQAGPQRPAPDAKGKTP